MEWLNYLIDTYNIPLLSAFLIGIMTSISPCPLATNITAIAFISKDIKTVKNTLLNGLFYTLGRGISYTLLATLIYFGLSSFSISSVFQGWENKFLGPFLILIGLIMADIIKINFKTNNSKIENIKLWLAKKGYLGSLLLGMIFALAFCPYSGVLFFGVLIPMVLKSSESLLLPPLFALGTGLPVIIFSFIIAFSFNKLSLIFTKVSQVEKIIRKIIAAIFIIIGIYYLQYLFQFIFNHYKQKKVTIAVCPTCFEYTQKLDQKKYTVIKTKSTSESLQLFKNGQVDYIFAGRTLKPDEPKMDSYIIKNGYSFLSDIEKTIKTKDLNKYQMYTDLDDKLISSILNLDNIKKVENIYQYLNQGIVVTSWENTDYSKAQIVHVFDDNGNRLTLSRQPTLYCPNSCSSKLLSDISNL